MKVPSVSKMENQDPVKGTGFCPHGSWLKARVLCLFEGSQEHSLASHQVTVEKP